MAKRDAFLLRIDPRVLAAYRRWADAELRSLNGQLEFVLRNLLEREGRWPPPAADDSQSETAPEESPE